MGVKETKGSWLSWKIRCKGLRNVQILDDFYYQPDGVYEMRSTTFGGVGGSGHQVINSDAKSAILEGVSAGTADKEVTLWQGNWPLAHLEADVKPFVFAAQLDGNPVTGFESGLIPYRNLSRPLLREAGHLRSYLEWRPPTGNPNKAMLSPRECE